MTVCIYVCFSLLLLINFFIIILYYYSLLFSLLSPLPFPLAMA